MNQEKSTCNPLELWPTRSHKKLLVKKSSTRGGYHDGINGEVVVPIDNDAYSRTVRMHEAGHSLFSKRKIHCDDAVAQGIEDARVHTLITTQGTAKRDELSVAIRDLHVPKTHTVNRALACIVSLRAGAILFKDKGSKVGSLHTASWLRAVKRLKRMAGIVGPKFYGSLREALDLLEDGDQWQKAEEVIRNAVKLANAEAEPKKAEPKVEPMPKPKAPAPKTDGEPMPAPPKLDGDEEPEPEPAPEPKEAEEGAGEGEASDGEAEPAEDGEAEDEDEDEDDDSSASDSLGDVPSSTFTKKTLVIDKTKIKKGVYATADLEELSKGITKEAAALLSESSKERIDSEGDTFPTLNIVPIFKSDPVRTQVGSSVHHSIAGARIDAKKLSLVITPGTHRIFTKKKRNNGGTIVIDASGSMQFDLADLEAILLEAPVSTIAFYNAKSDAYKSGNLWIFAYRGKRARDLTGPGLPKEEEWLMKEDESVPEAKRWGYGNVVDFQVCEWLLAQPKPRYFVTDKKFVGSSSTSNKMAFELTQKAEDAGLLQCVWSPDHKKSPKYTFELLRKMLSRNTGK